MSAPLFDSNGYYYLSSDRYGPSYLLGDGFKSNAPGMLSLSQTILSSSNWQIFYQDPIYLIRNYDFGARYQLGIAEESPTLPALLLASGDLTQQWNLTLWDDGTFRLANLWLGSTQILGIGANDDTPIPAMTAAQNGTHWSFTIDINNGTSNLAPDMLQSVSLQAGPSSTSTLTLATLSTAASTIWSSTAAGILLATTTITAGSVSSSSSSADSQYTTRGPISGGAIAGIGMAIFASALVVSGLLFFMWWRRQQQRHGLLANQAALGQQREQDWCTAMHEADTRHPASEMGASNEREGMRCPAVEIPG